MQETDMRKTFLGDALRSAIGAWAVLLLLPAFSSAQSGANAVEEFGLLGTWAGDCSQSPSPANARATYSTTSSGGLQLKYESGGDYADSTYNISDAKQVAPDKLSMHQVLIGNDQVTLDIVLLKDSGRIRIWSSTFPDGTALVEEGILTSFTGRETRWMSRCP
jgi:hypothetical protein